ncbi:hypothetical protein DF186_23715, partial [Enterococcus hirae]
TQIFNTIKRHDIRLNPAKYTFAVETNKFLNFIITQKKIETNPDKYRIVLDMKNPTYIKEIQQLNGKLTALSRFLTGSAI